MAAPTEPLPPPDLRNRVAGTPDAAWYVRSGEMTLRDLRAALDETLGLSFPDFETINDFGCGPGPLTRWLAAAAPTATLWPSDIDGQATEWLKTAIPAASEPNRSPARQRPN